MTIFKSKRETIFNSDKKANALVNMGMSLTDARVNAYIVKPGRGVMVETLNGGTARWTGETDGVTTRTHLRVPYRMGPPTQDDPTHQVSVPKHTVYRVSGSQIIQHIRIRRIR